MEKNVYEFKFGFLQKKVQMFHCEDMGVVIEKATGTICVYATNEIYTNIFCAIPLGPSRYLKGLTYKVSFYDGFMTVSVGDFIAHFDYRNRRYSNNLGYSMVGSDEWEKELWNDEY